MKKYFFLLISIALCTNCNTQNSIPNSKNKIINNSKPKLVVGIVVDQMRYDYLTRFSSKFGEGGFKRMINEGYNCKNNHFNYTPTYTAPGHSSIFTGTTPKYHGIIGNNWYDKVADTSVYCTSDASVLSIGTNDDAGKMSPHRMKATTFSDENRLFTQMHGKTIGISIKDRGAILPAGHTANAAYWFHGGEEGIWISSSFYMDKLPNWVQSFNDSGKAKSYLKPWNTLQEINTYTESGKDQNDFENGFTGKTTATFPYDLKHLSTENSGYSILKTTPFGNNLITDFAIAAIHGENLGKDKHTDVLTISYSCTDYIGHNFGVNSKEVEDAYIRLDQDLERLFVLLDKKIGKNEYTVFLTSDHGAIEVPSYLQSLKIPSGYVNYVPLKEKITAFMIQTYGSEELIKNISNNQIFLNREKIKSLHLDLETVQKAIVNEIITYQYVDKAYTATEIRGMSYTNGIEELLQNGYNQKRSGDIMLVMDIAYISYSKKGSTHGSGFNYDTHVPLLFFGKGIKHGSTFEKTKAIDIAPTMSALLGISFPNASTGSVLTNVLK